MLNGSGPYHLTMLVNKEPFTGDGPVTAVKVLYKQVNASSWETVQGTCVSLENLRFPSNEPLVILYKTISPIFQSVNVSRIKVTFLWSSVNVFFESYSDDYTEQLT